MSEQIEAELRAATLEFGAATLENFAAELQVTACPPLLRAAADEVVEQVKAKARATAAALRRQAQQ